MKKRIIAGAIFLLIGLVSESTSPARANVLPDAGIRNILSTELPTGLLADIKKEYQSYWITGLYEEGKIK